MEDESDAFSQSLQRRIAREDAMRCAKALAHLRDRDRKLIVLRVIYELPCMDVATRLGMSTSAAVHVAVGRALRRLEKRLNYVGP